jgi:hypothetical protein
MIAELKALDMVSRRIDGMRLGLPGGGTDGDVQTVKACAALSRDAQERARALATRAETLPDPLRFDVGAAASGLANCLACMSGEMPIQYCAEAREQIAAANKDYPKMKW